MKFTTKNKNKSIYSPISPEYSPISDDEESSSNHREKKNKFHRKRASENRELSRRVDKYGRDKDRCDREDKSKVRHEKSRDRSEKYDCNVSRSRHKSHRHHHKHDRHKSSTRKEHKKSDRSKERSRNKRKSKHKKHGKKRRRSTSKSSSTSSSDSEDDLKTSSFISEILKNKKTKNSEKVLNEVRETINNELNDENVSYTPPLKPEMTKADNKKIFDLKKSKTQNLIISNGNKQDLDENCNVSLTSESKSTQKSNDVQKSTANNVKTNQIDIKKIKVTNGNQKTSSKKSNHIQKPTISNGSHKKKKSVLDLPMPPDTYNIDIPMTPSPQESIIDFQNPPSEPDKMPSIKVSIPLEMIFNNNDIVPIIAANFENSQLKKGIISHPDLIPLPPENQIPANDLAHFKEMQTHLQQGAIFTPFEHKVTSPEFTKPARPSIVNASTRSGKKLGNQSFENFKILEQVGKGTYGKVFKAIDLKTHEKVAMKYIKVDHESEGFPITCLREIRILRQLDHPNIIKLKDIVFRHEKNSTYLIFDYMNHDLLGLRINKEMKFEESHIYEIVKQILEGINYCHQNQIIHRDLKLSNILMNNKGEVKICDFGLSRMWQENRPYTNKVISLWYRPIELLLGEEIYGPAVDIWSIGCIIYELFRRRPLFEYNTELEIVNAIFNVCGTPEYNMWPEVKILPKYKIFKPLPRMRNLKNSLFPTLPPLAIDLVDQMLALNPDKRITAENALKTNWMIKMESVDKKPMILPKIDSLEMRAREFL